MGIKRKTGFCTVLFIAQFVLSYAGLGVPRRPRCTTFRIAPHSSAHPPKPKTMPFFVERLSWFVSGRVDACLYSARKVFLCLAWSASREWL